MVGLQTTFGDLEHTGKARLEHLSFYDHSLGRALKHNQVFRNASFYFMRFHTVDEFRRV